MQNEQLLHSRVHRLKIGDAYNISCYIKREDELGCLTSGSKARKYQTQLHALIKKGYKKVGLIGGSSSNHVLGLVPLLIENGIEPALFLLESKDKPIGNALFIRLFVSQKNIHNISRNRWAEVLAIANAWAEDNDAYIIPEGGVTPESLTGLTTLAHDIVQNEQEAGCSFNDILIDSGSGITAATLIATLGCIKKKSHVHVLQCAPCDFTALLEEVKQVLGATTTPPFTLYKPTTAKSFGSTNARIFNQIAQTAKIEGFFLDPIYSAKLYLLLEKLLRENALKGPVLFIHSGGVFSLSGFQHRFSL